MAKWYIKRVSQTTGPLTLERLNELVSQGEIQETDLVSEGEDGPYKTVAHISGLLPENNSEVWGETEPGTQLQSKVSTSKKSNLRSIVLLAVFASGGILVVLALLVFILPALQQTREKEWRAVSKNNLGQIALALHNYHDSHSTFPPGGTETAEGEPYHSWQTLILPFVEEQARLHNQIDFDQPWTDPANQLLFQTEIPRYLNPAISEKVSQKGLGLSHYVGNKFLMKTNQSMRISDIKDGMSSTIMAVETGENFKPWGDPSNIADPVNIIGGKKKSPFTGGRHVMMSNGRVRFVSEKIDAGLLKKLSTPDNGDLVHGF